MDICYVQILTCIYTIALRENNKDDFFDMKIRSEYRILFDKTPEA